MKVKKTYSEYLQLYREYESNPTPSGWDKAHKAYMDYSKTHDDELGVLGEYGRYVEEKK